MFNFSNNTKRRVYNVILFLLIIEIFAVVIVLGTTYAIKAERAEHVLVFDGRTLSWNSEDNKVSDDGSLELSVFDNEYVNVISSDGKKVIAPGTEGGALIRLLNTSKRKIEFAATLYSLKSDTNLPVDISLNADYEEYTPVLPDGVNESAVIKSVTGVMAPGSLADFNIEWTWIFDGDDDIDTYFGDKAVNDPDNAQVGFYLVLLRADGGTVEPVQTGDNSLLIYCILLSLSVLFIIIILVLKLRDKKNSKKEEGVCNE